jgi:cellulose synthase/poly-beta-1,6-N-acetylglucosamine synthase-like glycosyltransferase
LILVFKILFWLSLFLILHSYVIYPAILILLAFFQGKKPIQYEKPEILPHVSILMAAYNEEEIIEEKIKSILSSDYPLEKLTIYIGSDNSTDNTNEIVKRYAQNHSQVKFYPFTERQGKPNIINQLAQKSDDEIFILTDANVLFDRNTIMELIKPFANSEIGLVDSKMINKGLQRDGISVQEKTYISREVNIKNLEGLLWGTMMGPFGGCFAIRNTLYEKVPSTFLVDDFYINMKVLEKGKKAVNNIHAHVYEDVSNNLGDEFRRKIRIATGNFQNLVAFKKLLNPKYKGLAFSFLSHKVIRWLGPLLFAFIIISNIFLVEEHLFYLWFIFFIFMIIIIPIIDFFLRKIKIHIIILRFITHFVSMNIALFIGMFKFLKGVKSNVWQPTKRNQTK